MLRKIFILFMLVLLTGCTNSAATASSASVSAKDYADKIISDLSLTDMEEVKKRVIIGGLFDEKKDVCSDASMYRSSIEGNNDTIGVFITDDPASCRSYLEDYLVSLKKESEMAYPTEVFKISNAILAENDTMVIMIVCENIEDAKREADALLNI